MSGERLVVPSLVGRTNEVDRVVLEVKGIDRGDVTISVEMPTEEPSIGTARIISIDQFMVRAGETIGRARAEAIGELAEWWRSAHNGIVKLGKRSLNLSVPYRHTAGRSVSVLTLYLNGRAEGSVDPIANWRRIMPVEECLDQFTAAGFGARMCGPSVNTI